MKPVLVYVVGPYRSRFGVIGRAWNIFRAWRTGRALARLGLVPVVPHMSCAFYDDLQPDAFWLEGTKELMRRCDAVFCMPSWESSEGSRGEVNESERIGLPVLVDLTGLFLWAAQKKREAIAVKG